MLDRLIIPPKLVARALDDLHTVAQALRELAADEGLLASVSRTVAELPRVEDELSARIDRLRAEVRELHEWLRPLHEELSDLDETAESLQRQLAHVNESILELQALLKKIPGV